MSNVTFSSLGQTAAAIRPSLGQTAAAIRIQARVRGYFTKRYYGPLLYIGSEPRILVHAIRIQAWVRGYFCRKMFDSDCLYGLMPDAWNDAAEILEDDENIQYMIVASFIQGGVTRAFCQQWPPLCYFWIFVLKKKSDGKIMKIVSSVDKTTYENLSKHDFPDEKMYDATHSGIHTFFRQESVWEYGGIY